MAALQDDLLIGGIHKEPLLTTYMGLVEHSAARGRARMAKCVKKMAECVKKKNMRLTVLSVLHECAVTWLWRTTTVLFFRASG